MSRNRSYRGGFTLIEILVVIIIIGILAAVLLPAVSAVIYQTRVARIGVEVQALANVLEAMKTDFGSYPPDFEEFDRNREMKNWTWGEYQQTNTGRFMRKNFPKIQALDIKFLLQASPAIDNSEALVLWLKGVSTNPRAPFTGPDGPGSFAGPTAQVDSRFEFEFDPTRLADRDNDGFDEYYPPFAPTTGVPYAYFNSANYSTSMPAALFPTQPATNGRAFLHAEHSPTALWNVVFDLSSGGTPTYTAVALPDPDPTSPIGVTRPMKSNEVIPPANRNPLDTHRGADLYYVNRTKFQIISGGMDGKYGLALYMFNNGEPLPPPNGNKVWPAIVSPTAGYAVVDRDNVTNFSEGGELGDLVQ